MAERSLARRTLIAALSALPMILGACALPAHPAQAKPAAGAQTLRVEPLEVVTSQGAYRFKVEVADTEASREKGLMYRTFLAPDRGMLFDFKTPRQVAFWMRNTLIPLDMVFIGADGRVISIARNAVPHDETPIPGRGEILGVLEIAGGRAAQIGLLPGDRIKHRIFPRG